MTEGEVFDVVYPFVRDTYNEPDFDTEGGGYNEVPTWKPGVRFEERSAGAVESCADALGTMRLTVVSVHKPGRFPTRVFYTRAWVNPDGKAFGKSKLRVTTAGPFRVLTHGYRHSYVLVGCDCVACAWPWNDHRKRLFVIKEQVS